MVNQALFSNKKDYRYMLFRSWDKSRPTLGIIGLKPSTSDILEQINIAKSLGYGSLYSLNLFGFLETKDILLEDINNPIGTSNNKYLKHYISQCEVVVCAWGNRGKLGDRGKEVRKMFNNLYYFELNSLGEPTHFSNLGSDKFELKLI